MKRYGKRAVCLVLAIMLIPSLSCAEPTVFIEPYAQNSIPGWAKDLRRAEIISLGSMPFVTLGVTLGYSCFRYFSNGMDAAYFPNPFAKSSNSANLNKSEQLGILAGAAAISLLIGVTDFIINTVQRRQEIRRQQEQESGSVEIIPVTNSPEKDFSVEESIIYTTGVSR